MCKYCLIVGRINNFLGQVLTWVILPMSIIVTYDVIARYVFNRPTIWAYDVNVQLLAFMATLGGGYALLNENHVRIDILAGKLSKRNRAILESITGALTILALGILTYYLITQAYSSVLQRELNWSYFAEPVYPLRVVMAFGSLMLFLQSISFFLQNLFKSLGREMVIEVETTN